MKPFRALTLTLGGLASMGCSDETGSAAASTTGAPTGCEPGEWRRDDGTCVPAGLPPDMPCPPGEWLRESDAACIPAGVPPDGCGAGFVHDGDRGCEPILPGEPCPPGLMAVPGDTECHEIAPCGTGTWGDIRVEPDTEHVDQSYPGADSDGSALKPWKTIGEGVIAAADGAVVAIAAGSYLEDVLIEGKPVRLRGRCPAMVEIVGTGAALAAVLVLRGSDGTEVGTIAVRGPAYGLALTASENVLVDRSWVHHNAKRGISAEDALGPTGITVRSSLVEDNEVVGVFALGAEAVIDGCTVRGTRPGEGALGRGVEVLSRGTTGSPSNVTLRGSLLEDNRDAGVFVLGSSALVEATVLRDHVSDLDAAPGRGVGVVPDGATGAPSKLTVRGSVVRDNRGAGVTVQGSEALVEATVVRTLPTAGGLHGAGVVAQFDPSTAGPSSVTVLASLLDENHEVGIVVSGSDAVVESTLVRGTLPDSKGLAGRGVYAHADPAARAPASLVLRSSSLEQNHEVGLFVAGSEALVEQTVVRATLPDSLGSAGRGVQVQADTTTGAPGKLTMRSCRIEASRQVGLFVGGSSATVETSLIVETTADDAGQLGDGITVASDTGPADIAVSGTRIEQSARAAVAAFGATVAFDHSALVCQGIDLFGAAYKGFAVALDDLGGNLCGCPEATGGCLAKGEGLEAPPPIGGLE